MKRWAPVGWALLVIGQGSCSQELPVTQRSEPWRWASERITIEGRVYRLRTKLWLNLQPVVGARPLIALIQVVEQEGREIPRSIDADRVWVIRGKETWEAPLADETPQEAAALPPMELERIAREGPVWDTDSTVEVVVRLIASQGKTHYLKASGQTIEQVF